MCGRFVQAGSPKQLSDILFDTWALTTIRDVLPGRPPVEPYLHGISECVYATLERPSRFLVE